MDDEYLKVEEVAKKLRVTRQAIYNWITEGRLKAVKVGKSLRIPSSAIVAFLEPVKPGEPLKDDEPGPMMPAGAGA